MKTVDTAIGEKICRLEEILLDTGVGALVKGQTIAIFRLASPEADGLDEVYAIGGVDPFTGVAVLSRGLIGSVDGEPYVASPLYKQRFSLKTGICLDEESVKVDTFPVVVEQGSVFVSVSESSALETNK